MSDKSTSSKTPAATATETPLVSSPPRKIYTIVKYGDPILEKPGAPVKKFDSELEELAEDMFASMYAAQGVGLAAPQIGKSVRFAVVDVTGGKNPEAKIVLVNPEVTHAEGEVRGSQYGFLERVSGLDQDLHGQARRQDLHQDRRHAFAQTLL